MVVEQIGAFVRDASGGDFGRLALQAFEFQFARIAAFREMCERSGATPETVGDWREIPMIPTRAFKTMEIATGEGREVFRSSGTTGGQRSVHRHPHPDLYRATIEAAFAENCLPTPGRLPTMSLIPSREQLEDSSLSFMVDHVMRTWGAPSSLYAVGPRGIEPKRLRAWLAARQREARPVLVMSTSFSLVEALETLERLGLRFRLPPGSVLFETGGYKGRSRRLEARELARQAEEWMGIAPDHIVREYGMTELTSQLYTRALDGGAPDLFQVPHWCRYRVLDPETLSDAQPGEVGLIAILDLANLGSALHLLTEDLGTAEPQGLRLVGRAGGAELRGCSLAAEELSGAG